MTGNVTILTVGNGRRVLGRHPPIQVSERIEQLAVQDSNPPSSSVWHGSASERLVETSANVDENMRRRTACRVYGANFGLCLIKIGRSA